MDRRTSRARSKQAIEGILAFGGHTRSLLSGGIWHLPPQTTPLVSHFLSKIRTPTDRLGHGWEFKFLYIMFPRITPVLDPRKDWFQD